MSEINLIYIHIFFRLVISIFGIAGYNYYKIRKTSEDKKGRYHVLPSHKNESLD